MRVLGPILVLLVGCPGADPPAKQPPPNTPPALTRVRITPTPAFDGDVLTCTASAIDADGDEVQITYQWSTGDEGDTTTAPARDTEVVCTATPDDGVDLGAPVTARIVVANAAPEMGTVAIEPASPSPGEDLSCVATASDRDRDPVVFTYAWTVQASPAGAGPVLAAGSAARGDAVVCTVTASDGDADSDALSATVVVGNTPPVVVSVTLSPDPAVTTDTLTATAVLDDADGDPTTVTSWSWAVNGVDVVGADTNTLDGSAFVRADAVTATVVAHDGFQDGPPSTSPPLVIANSPPTAPVLAIAPVDPAPGEALSCGVVLDGTDPDLDAVYYAASWYRNGVLHGPSAPTGAEVELWDEWRCVYDTTDLADPGEQGMVSVFATPVPTTRLAVVGEYGTDGAEPAAVAALVESWAPSQVLTVGGNNLPAGAAATLDDHVGQYYADWIFPYLGSYPSSATSNKFWPALDEHDHDGGLTPFTDYFSLPGNERRYTRAMGVMRLFTIDSDPREPLGNTVGSAQADWFRSTLTVTTRPVRIPYFHHPPYSSGPGGNTAALHWDWAAAGMDLVLSGHERHYERVEVEGLTYLVLGNGGMPLTPVVEPVGGSMIAADTLHGAALVEVGDPYTRVVVEGVDGTILDRFERMDGHDDAEVALVDFGATWSWLDGGVDPGAGWTDPAFDDTSWSAGPAPLGYGSSETTAVGFGGDPVDKHVTTWFRHAFTLSEVPVSALVRVLRDDGLRVWLNGAEVGRIYLPAGTVGASDLATRDVDDEGAYDERIVDPGLLRVGTNVLAVEVHQAAVDSPDLLFDLALLARGDTAWVPRGATWARWDGAGPPGDRWAHLDHDDSSWASGTPSDFQGRATWFYRYGFTGGTTPGALWLEILRSDASAVFLNGSEIARWDLPADPSWNGYAAQGAPDGWQDRWIRVQVDPRRVWPGDNVLAVEVHAEGGSDPDHAFDAALVGW